MTWPQRLACLLLVTASAGSGLFFYVCIEFVRHLDTRVNGPSGLIMRAEGVESKANATLINVDNGTKVWAAAAKAQSDAVLDLVTDAHGTLSGANAALFTINDSAHTLNDDLGQLHGTIAGASDLTAQAEVDLRTLNGSFAALTPLLGHSDAAVSDLDALLKRKAIEQILDHAAGVVAHADSITGDADKVTTKLTNDFLAPKAWYRKVVPSIGDFWDIAAAAARSAP
jgi:hypothetical protein